MLRSSPPTSANPIHRFLLHADQSSGDLQDDLRRIRCLYSFLVTPPCHLRRRPILFVRSHLSRLFSERSISEDSLRRYVSYASESCIQELLSASESGRVGGNDGWKVLALDDGVEISRRRAGSLHVFRSRWLLQSVSPRQFMTVANAIDAAKVGLLMLHLDQ